MKLPVSSFVESFRQHRANNLWLPSFGYRASAVKLRSQKKKIQVWNFSISLVYKQRNSDNQQFMIHHQVILKRNGTNTSILQVYYIYLANCAEDLATGHDGYPNFYMLIAVHSATLSINDPYKGTTTIHKAWRLGRVGGTRVPKH